MAVSPANSNRNYYMAAAALVGVTPWVVPAIYGAIDDSSTAKTSALIIGCIELGLLAIGFAYHHTITRNYSVQDETSLFRTHWGTRARPLLTEDVYQGV